MADVRGAAVSADGKTFLVRARSGWSLVDEKGKKGKVPQIDKVKLRVVPEAEWAQILRECWRIQRDFFYDPNLHGVDWPKMWDRWSALLPHVQHRADLNILISEMMVPGSTYWNVAFGRGKGEVADDEEGIATIKTLARNMAWLMKKLAD